MGRYSHITRPGKKSAVGKELDASFHVRRGYYEIPKDSPMRNHLEDWMVPISAYPSGSWVPVWLYLLWEMSETPTGWKNRVRDLREDREKLVSLLVNELVRRKGGTDGRMIVAIKACLAKYRRGTT